MSSRYALTHDDYDAMLPGAQEDGGPKRWTLERVDLRFTAAVSTLRRIPVSDARFLRDSLAAKWPDAPVQWIEYGSVEASARPPMPSTRAVTQMEEVLGWYCAYLAPAKLPPDLPLDAGQIIWGRATGFSWRRICLMRRARSRAETRGNDPRTVKHYHAHTLHWIAECLNRANVEVREPA